MPSPAVSAPASEATRDGTALVDVAVVGAGFAGLYLLYRLRKADFVTVVLEEAMSAVPGTGTYILALAATFRLSTTATRFKRRILDTAFRYSFNLTLTSLWS